VDETRKRIKIVEKILQEDLEDLTDPYDVLDMMKMSEKDLKDHLKEARKINKGDFDGG